MIALAPAPKQVPIEWWRVTQAAAVTTSRLLRILPVDDWPATRQIEHELIQRWSTAGRIKQPTGNELRQLAGLKPTRSTRVQPRPYPLAALASILHRAKIDRRDRCTIEPSLAVIVAEIIAPATSVAAIRVRGDRLRKAGALTEREADAVATALGRHIAEIWPDEYWSFS